MKLKDLKKYLKEQYEEEEIYQLIHLKEKYREILKIKGTNNIKLKLNKIANILIISSEYYERLTYIKTRLKILKVDSKNLKIKKENKIRIDESFNKLPKKDQDNKIKIDTFKYLTFLDLVTAKIDIIDSCLDYHSKLQWNCRTIISGLKGQINSKDYEKI